jgi:hypothetical protein
MVRRIEEDFIPGAGPAALPPQDAPPETEPEKEERRKAYEARTQRL